MKIQKPYLLFLGDVQDRAFAKTACGILDWAPEACLGKYALPECFIDFDLPAMSPREAAAKGAKSFVLGVAPIGGHIPQSWVNTIMEALEAGLDVVSGMHTRLQMIPGLREAALRTGRRLIDVRHYDAQLPIANGEKRKGKRLLTVGVDCAVGKKYTALSITSALQNAGQTATFRATGQTGIIISGGGIPIDAIKSDFIAGAAEILSPDNDENHWDVIEGQGSLYHPAYAGVTLGLLHGSQPDFIVLCHDASRKHIYGYRDYPLPNLGEAIDLYLKMGRLTNQAVRCAGISVNTSGMNDAARLALLGKIGAAYSLPVIDPVETGAEELLERLLKEV